MSEPKFSPGPWTNHGRVPTQGLPHSGVAAETLIARVYSKHFGDAEQETANANLIAAAPDLFEALQSALKTAEFEQHAARPWHHEARAAIRKALGE